MTRNVNVYHTEPNKRNEQHIYNEQYNQNVMVDLDHLKGKIFQDKHVFIVPSFTYYHFHQRNIYTCY